MALACLPAPLLGSPGLVPAAAPGGSWQQHLSRLVPRKTFVCLFTAR